MLVKKPKQRKVPEQDDNTIVLGSGFGGAGQSSYTLNTGAGIGGSSGIDTITIDSSLYSSGSLTSASTSTMTWNPMVNHNWTTGTNTAVNISTDGITMQPGTDINVGGRSLMNAIDKMEERLGILNPNPELEDRWDQLKELRKQYIELEKDLLEKEKLMKILKEK
jgi:hypothetical protein